MNYYNEHDPKAAAWLRELIAANLIAPGEVDERSIADVKPSDLIGFRQCHFFAGIGGWSYALRLAGWDDDRPVWTGSCPCQPFSCAGKQRGTADERHLWPEFARLIRECRPAAVFGEQVASKAGRQWLAGVFVDLEGMGYAGAGADLCAASVGAPHIRQRLYWVANAQHAIGRPQHGQDERNGNDVGREEAHGQPGACGEVCRLANAGHEQAGRAARSGETEGGRAFGDAPGCGDLGRLGDTGRPRLSERIGNGGVQRETMGAHAGQAVECGGDVGRLGDTSGGGCGIGGYAAQPGSGRHVERTGGAGLGRLGDAESREQWRTRQSKSELRREGEAGGSGAWGNFDILPCRDGKARRVESKPFAMADGVSAQLDALRDAGLSANQIEAATETFPLTNHAVGRVMLLRGYGNAISPELAAQFIRAAEESIAR